MLQELQDAIEYSEGMEIECGWVSDLLITDVENREAVLPNAKVLVTDQKVTQMSELLGVLDQDPRVHLRGASRGGVCGPCGGALAAGGA